MERSRDDLADRADLVGQLLLAELHHERRSRAGRDEVQQLAGDALAHGEEGLLRDLVERPVELARELLGARTGDRRIGIEHRAEVVDAQGHDGGSGHRLDARRRRTADGER
jgi:hypothetical protein